MERIQTLVILASEGGQFQHGGVARHVDEIAREFAQSLCVTVVVVPSYCLSRVPSKDSLAEEMRHGARFVYLTCANHVRCLRSRRFDQKAYALATEKMLTWLAPLLPNRIDALLLEDHYETGLAFGLLPRCRAKGFVNFAHLPLSARFSYFDKGVDESRQQILEAAAMIGSLAIIAPSNYAMRTVRNVYPVSTDRIQVVPLAVRQVDQEVMRPEERGCKILTVARFSDQKGWDSYLAVAEQVERMDLAPTWHLVGQGVNCDAVLQRLSAFVPKDRICADEHLNAEMQLPKAMLDSAVFFLPSSYETFGLAPLEAAAHGAVPVLSGIGGFAEIWGHFGFTCSPGDVQSASSRIGALLRDTDYRVAQAELARRIACSYKWDAHCAQLKDVLFA